MNEHQLSDAGHYSAMQKVMQKREQRARDVYYLMAVDYATGEALDLFRKSAKHLVVAMEKYPAQSDIVEGWVERVRHAWRELERQRPWALRDKIMKILRTRTEDRPVYIIDDVRKKTPRELVTKSRTANDGIHEAKLAIGMLTASSQGLAKMAGDPKVSKDRKKLAADLKDKIDAVLSAWSSSEHQPASEPPPEKTASLRSAVIRLANENQELRPVLLPLLTQRRASRGLGYDLDVIAKGLARRGIKTVKRPNLQLGKEVLLLPSSSNPGIPGSSSIIIGLRNDERTGFWFADPGSTFSEDRDKYKGVDGEFPNKGADINNRFLIEDIAAKVLKLLGSYESAPEPESASPWSVVALDKDGYAAEVETFNSRAEAMSEARGRGGVYVVRGTQMWNEPLGQVEEHSRTAKYVFVP